MEPHYRAPPSFGHMFMQYSGYSQEMEDTGTSEVIFEGSLEIIKYYWDSPYTPFNAQHPSVCHISEREESGITLTCFVQNSESSATAKLGLTPRLLGTSVTKAGISDRVGMIYMSHSVNDVRS